MEIKDSGEKTEYSTGAVRDCKKGKGKCTLLPLAVSSRLLELSDPGYKRTLFNFKRFQDTADVDWLYYAIRDFAQENNYSVYSCLLDASHQFEDGAAKYGENNWQKGIPVSSYIDSAIRHYLKFKAGWQDEPHGHAFIWNVLCCAWTMVNNRDMDDYTKIKEMPIVEL